MKISWSKILILSTFFAACSSSKKAIINLPEPIVVEWQQMIDSTFAQAKIPGLMVGILQKGKPSYHTAGYADVENKIAFDESKIFEAGSITKTFTALVLTSVLQENNIAATTSILQFLPDSIQQNTALDSVTFLSLMNHTSGLPRMPSNISATVTNQAQPYENYSDQHLFSYLKMTKPVATGNYSYSNLGAGLAGVLAGIISKKSYTQLLKEKVFVPFSIKVSNTGNSKKSIGYWNDKPTPYWNMNALKAAGTLQCSVAEMLAYLEAMSNPPTATIKVIIDTLTTANVTVSKRVNNGRGWHTLNKEGVILFYWHSGGTYGFSTFAAFEKGTGNAVVVVINTFNKNKVSDELGAKIMEKLLDQN